MSTSISPSTQYSASNFVVSAGCVLFRKREGALELCIIHDRKRDQWVLPKGRKDCGESTAEAAVRETFEETGYRCELLPCRMATRAPRPGVNTLDRVEVIDNITEPFSVVIWQQGEQGVKLVWWFIGRATSDDKVLGTQAAWEEYDSHFVEAEEACTRLKYQSEMDTAREAIQIVRDGNMGGL
ncbi:Nudix hydrolase domain-containing protein [Mycena indigotica]|uniref:Nudix hydrolase domain-containing protein n=1 Tax=Mycena indigotica TaxID=2126181 RepID=A0A8H6WC04_9AGAR|nr:Nudix hydrolase domain-containing protein [Mycena indigotica]KAF7312347.1 Nudix hydrolase domain-containing protein [Mycena indigotica]